MPSIAREVSVSGEGAILEGTVEVPPDARGLVIFAHGSGSGRFSPRNRAVAAALRARGLCTFLLDLLTPAEAEDRATVFDVALLARRLSLAAAFAAADRCLRDLPLGYFGASTGAAAALIGAAADPARVRAVVSRGGRPDLAAAQLAAVRAPTLLIVGGADVAVLALNRRALALLPPQSRLEIVPGATHLFEEPGALDAVSALAGAWFRQWLDGEAAPSA